MSLTDLLAQRSSIRAFEKRAIDSQLLTEVFETAQHSPSNCNVQPWQTLVVSGNSLEMLREKLVKEVMSGKPPCPDFDWLPKYQDIHRDRQFDSANTLYSAMNIERSDKPARQLSMLRNWQFFGAPTAVFFCMKKYLGIMGAVDLGIYAQTVALLMQDKGLSCCMQGALGQFPHPIREQLGIPEDVGILFGMSVGYEQAKAAVNNAKTGRAKIEQSVSFFE
jgi:nitroreductase